MTAPVPTIGCIVHYTLSALDAEAINKRRKDARRNLNAAGVTLASQELGAQIHVGNAVEAGEVYPLIITRVWGDQPHSAVNGQVLLDGGDCYWATSVSAGEGERRFVWPGRS